MKMEWREMETGMEMEMEMDLACFDGELTLVGGLDHALASAQESTVQYDTLQCLTVLGPSTSAVRSSSLITRSGSQPGRYSRPLVGGREPGEILHGRVKELELEYPYRPYRLACQGLVEVRTTFHVLRRCSSHPWPSVAWPTL